MYRQTEVEITTSANVELKFEGKLATDNRWVIMSERKDSGKKCQRGENLIE